MDADHARELLTQAREQAEAELERHKPEPDEELSQIDQHPADTATDLFERELDEGLSEPLRERLMAIERAERRLDEGTYGVSVVSGKPIPDERLEAIPWADRAADEA